MTFRQRLRIYLGLEKQQPPAGFSFPPGPWGGPPACDRCGALVAPAQVDRHRRSPEETSHAGS